MFAKAVEVFRGIKKPDEVNMLLLFNACAQLQTKEALALVKDVVSKMPSSFHVHSNLANSLLDAYLKCGDLEAAEMIFRRSATKEQSMYAAMMKSKPSALYP